MAVFTRVHLVSENQTVTVRRDDEHYQYADCLQKWDPRHEYARNRWALLEWLIEQTASEAGQ